MKSGYDQHFKKARQLAMGDSVPVKLEKDVVADKIKNNAMKRKQKIAHKKAEQKKSNRALVAFSVVGFAICASGLAFYTDVEKFLSKVDISWITSAQASDAQSVAPAAKPAEAKPEEKAAPSASPAELDHFAKLQERKKELDSREEELNRMEKEIQAQKVDLEKRMAELEEMRGKISAVLDERIKTDEKKIDSLVLVYTNMKPPQAAKVFETLDEDLAIEILGRMKKKSAADIMNLLKSEKAQAFSERMAGYRVPASK